MTGSVLRRLSCDVNLIFGYRRPLDQKNVVIEDREDNSGVCVRASVDRKQ
jgi:hypothetical protein